MVIMKKKYLISSSEIFEIVYRNGKRLGSYAEQSFKRRTIRAIRAICAFCKNGALNKPTAADFIAYIREERGEGTPSGEQVRSFAQMVFRLMYIKTMYSCSKKVCCTVNRIGENFIIYISCIYLYMRKLVSCY